MKAFKYLVVISIALFSLSCKDSDRDKDSSTNSSADFGHGESYSLNIFKMAHQAAFSAKGISTGNLADTTRLFGCDTMIIDTVSNPMSITLQFNGSCSYSGNSYQGEVVATFTGKYDNLGSQMDLSFNNFVYNGHPITGAQRVVFNGVLSGNPTYGITTTNLEVTDTTNGRTILFSGNQTLAVTAGETTATFSDDSYSISGNASGRAYAGNDFSVIIATNLIMQGSCDWVSSGTATVSPENKQPRDFDFGSSCDNAATVRIYGLVYEVVFPD